MINYEDYIHMVSLHGEALVNRLLPRTVAAMWRNRASVIYDKPLYIDSDQIPNKKQ